MIFLLAVLFGVLVISCQGGHQDERADYRYQYVKPADCADGLSTATLGDVGLRMDPFREMMDDIEDTDNHRIHSILVLKDNRLVFEAYFEGYAFSPSAPNNDGVWMQYGRETDQYLASETKSVTSLLVGIAFKEGYLGDVDRKVSDYFPEYADVLTGEKADITIRHLLTMTCGLAFDETTYPYGNPLNDVTQLFLNGDPVRFILSKDLVAKPGTSFFYNSGASNLLGAIIEKATGMGLLDFANQFLFEPLGTEGGVWESFPSGGLFASGGLHLRAREWLKIGTLMLNEGHWAGKPILGADWVQDSVQRACSTPGDPHASGYGYQWWLGGVRVNNHTWPCFYAAGWGDQYLFILPDFDMIMVINCGNFSWQPRISPFDLVQEYMVRALES